jgi:dTMP kinase
VAGDVTEGAGPVPGEGSTEPLPPEASPPVPIPPIEVPVPEVAEARTPYASILKLRNFRRLWIAMTISSLGDWVGLFALLSMTNRLSPGNTLAVAGLMIFRVLPAFLVGPLSGVLLDRVDRRKAMVVCDFARAGLIFCVPFVPTVPMLYAISFLMETMSLIWMPAKDALVPNLVPKRWLVATNSLALFTTYGVFPLGALWFTALVGVAQFVGSHVGALHALDISQENLALWIDTASFLASAIIVMRVRVPLMARERRPVQLEALWGELVEGLRYLKQRGEVARVMRSIAIALAGGAVVFSLGAPYATTVLHGGPKAFGGIVAALGTGMGFGVLVLGFVGDRFPKGWTAAFAVIAAGVMLVCAALAGNLVLALTFAGLFGAAAGVAYATLFALLQEIVHDEIRGRIFASVQVVIRVSLFASLVIFPALAQLFSSAVFGGRTAEGIRLALASGGLLTCAAGVHGAYDVYRGRIHSEARS